VLLPMPVTSYRKGTDMTEMQFGDATVKVFDDKQALVAGTVQFVVDALQEALRERGKAFLAISGGSTPKPVYAALKHVSGLDFSRVQVVFVDERNVPPTDEQSNFKMANEAWFDGSALPPTQVLRMKGELTAEEAAKEYELQLRQIGLPERDGFPVFDLILLGMGADGHTASLFPDTAALQEKQRWVAANWVEKLNTHRITLTYPVLNHARIAAFLAAGADKAEPMSEILAGGSKLPAAGVHPSGKLVWLVDSEAAAKLKSR
jgi:6-phosphogluconolactonase